MSDYVTLREAFAAKIKTLIGVSLPQQTIVYQGMTVERFEQEARVIAVNVALAGMSAAESTLLGDALSQAELWEWDVMVSAMGASDTNEGPDRAWDAVDAIRTGLCPGTGWKPEGVDGVSDLVMFVNVSPAGWSAAGAAVFIARFKHWRNLG